MRPIQPPVALFSAPLKALLTGLGRHSPQALLRAPGAALEATRGQLFPFAPVAMGLGIAGYFALPVEPGPLAIALAVLALGLALFLAARWREAGARAPLIMAVALVLLGGLAGILRSHQVSAPVLGFRYYGPIEGRVVAIDRAQSDQPRLTLDRVVLARTPPARTPYQVRVTLHGEATDAPLEIGAQIILTGHLSPPPPPSEPGGFDFRRHAWFQGLGAVGYTRTPVLRLAPASPGAAELALSRLRRNLAESLHSRLPGETGGFAAAVLTGDRSGLSATTNDSLRTANLYHIVAISGLHMGMLAGFVFGGLRAGLALVPGAALRLPLRKIAALAALAAAAFYLALAGRTVSTERAFIMVAVMLVAVLFDRRALSLRALAMAALIVLALRPEQIFNAGFHMSFAATLGLITTFVHLNRQARRSPFPRWLLPALALLLSSAIAGAVTAPFSAAHFNRVASYGLLANFLAVPAMGLVVMPAGVMAAVMAPLGLEGPFLWLLGQGADWILTVGDRVAALGGAARNVSAPPAAVLPLLTLGGLWLALWPGGARWMGLAPVVASFMLWNTSPRPALLITESGQQVGLLGPEGRALSRARAEGFSTRSWLERDGDSADPAQAAARPGFSGPTGARRFRFGGHTGVHLSGRAALDALADHCHSGQIVILAETAPPAPGDCLLIDAALLRERGSLSLLDTAQGLSLRGARDAAARRPWGR